MNKKSVVIRDENGVVVVSLQQPELPSGLAELLERTLRDRPEPDYVLDLGTLRFISSIDIGVLVTCFKHARHSGRRLALAGLDPRVKSVLEVMGLMKVFRAYDSIELALAAMRQGRLQGV